MTGIYDITTEANSDFKLEMQYTNYNDVAINLTNKKLVFSVKRTYLNIQDDVFSIHSDVNDQVEGTLEYPNSDNSYGSIEIIAISGEIVININKEVMQLLEPGQYFYALRLISSNFSENILKGKFEVQAFWMKNKLKIKYLKDNIVVVLRDLPKKIKVKKSKQYTVIVLTN